MLDHLSEDPITGEAQHSERNTTEKADLSTSASSDIQDESVQATNIDDGERNDTSMSKTQRRLAMFALCLTQFLSALDITIVATALPTITRTLGASAAEYAWVGSSYTLASTALTPIWAKMSDIFGQKAMLMLANGVFMAGSLVAALATSPGMLIGGRTLQGVGGGGIQVLVTIAIGTMFKLEDRAKYYGLTAGVWAVASALGPVLGGVFTEQIGWRWCFYINLPFDGASLALLFFILRLPKPIPPALAGLKSLDWIGSALIVGGTICFLFGLETGAGHTHTWSSATVISLLVIGILLLCAFFAFEATLAKTPIIPTRIFASLTNISALGLTCLHSFVFISYDYFLPLYFQIVLHLSPIISGVSMFALVIPLTICTGMTGIFVKRTGQYVWPIYFGVAVMTLGTGLFISFGRRLVWEKIVLYQIVAGVGAGPVFQTPLIALQANTRKEDLTAAMSAMTFMKSLFTSVSIVVGSVILQAKLGGQSLSAVHEDQTDDDGDRYVHALRTMWIFYTCVCAGMIFLAIGIKRTSLKN